MTKIALIAEISLLACFVLTVEGNNLRVETDALFRKPHDDNANLWNIVDEASKVERRRLIESVFDYDDVCADYATRRKCKNDDSCMWIKEKGQPGTCKAIADVGCDEVNKRKSCGLLEDRCFWVGKKNGGCLDTGDIQDCSDIDNKGLCRNYDGCAWVGGRNSGECMDEDDIECSDFERKNHCKRFDGCIWIGSPKDGDCMNEDDVECSDFDFRTCKKTSGCSWEGNKNTGSCEEDA